MNLFKRSRGLWMAGLMAVAVSALLPAVASAKPTPGVQPRGFRLFARTLGASAVNRVLLGLNAAKGHVGVDSLGSSTIGGGYWPKGTANQYVFNSGLQIAGKVVGPASFAWNGNTTGAFFFNARGDNEHGTEIEPIYNSLDPNDVADWPAAGRVPNELLPEDQLFNPLLRGRTNASQGDVWFLTWDGDPTLIGGRPHPLGVLVETRGLGWNFPAGNEDIVYFTFTFYNVTSSDPAAYSGVRPEIRDIVAQAGADFQRRNEATLGVSIPDEGYTLDSLFAGFGADMDVASAGANYCTVNLPFALGYCYEHTFGQEPGWQFDPGIFGSPFFPGNGFVGVKYLRSPTGPGEIQLFSNTVNSATGFRDPLDVFALFRYLSGNVSAAAGDQPCNQGNQLLTRICFINPTFADARFYQSSTALRLAPGEFGSIVVAYIFAAPVAIPGFAPPVADVPPGNPRLLSDIANLPQGANRIDSLTGFQGWSDEDANEVVDQDEFSVVPGSLLSKSLTAQAVFDNAFLLPFAPEAPQFYLIPGDNQVTVLWQKSSSETSGDPFFEVANTPAVLGSPNPLYDPNYRQFDVEGYRIYRGRVDNASGLSLVAQFDYAGTTIEDYTGQVNPTPGCYPTNVVDGVPTPITDDCPVEYDYPVPPDGTPATVSNSIPLVGEIIQVQLGPSRAVLADGTVIVLEADTAVTGAAGGKRPPLADTGVPFAYVDRDVKNNFRYFYSVTAFDVNSYQSGPSSLESALTSKAVTPVPNASNVNFAALEVTTVDGNGDPLPAPGLFTVDAATGKFSGRPPAVTGTQIQGVFAPALPALLPSLPEGALRATIDSVKTRGSGEPYPDEGIAAFNCNGLENVQGLCTEYFVTYLYNGARISTSTAVFQPILNQTFGEPRSAATDLNGILVPFDEASAARYGVPEGFGGSEAKISVTTGVSGESSAGEQYIGRRGQGNFAPGGSRWFVGDNETVDHPTVGRRVGDKAPGNITGVDSIFSPLSHIDWNPNVAGVQTAGSSLCLQVQNYGLTQMARQADIEVVWGAGGTLSRVRDLTHNVDIKFASTPQASWGFVPDGNGNGVIDQADVTFLEEAIQVQNHIGFCAGAGGPELVSPSVSALGVLPEPGNGLRMSQTAAILPVSNRSPGGGLGTAAAYLPANGNGIGFYIAGHYHIFYLTGGTLPPAGTRWVLRSTAGFLSATNPSTATPSNYVYNVRPAVASVPGLSVDYVVNAATSTRQVTNSDLARVHTVPDPYYVTNEFEQTTDNKILKFVNLPDQAIIRIYSSSGILVKVIEYQSEELGGAATWDLRNRNNQVVASGVYFYHLESGDARRVGRFTVVNFAQ
jgi:hypothetical protein